jgi:pimeloyl-ACP methyl ester carboxylesterase
LIVVVCLVIAFAALLGAGVVYQQIGEHRDRKRFPPPGRLVPIEGCLLHFSEQGNGAPAVILEAGIAASSLSWSTVQPLIARFTRAVSYDRAGLGWSERCSEARTLHEFTRQLSILLDKARVPPPYVLVGHSFGGLLIRAFACENPSQVAGLVFVDPVSLETWASCPKEDRRRLDFGVKLSRRGARLAQIGVVRFALAAASMQGQRVTKLITKASAGRATPFLARLIGEIRKLPPAVLPAVMAQWCRAKCFEAMAEHLAALPRCAEEASALRLPPDIPVVVLSAASATEDELRERDAWVQGNTRGRHLRIENTGHWLQLERPDAVVCAVKEMIEEYREGKRSAVQKPEL